MISRIFQYFQMQTVPDKKNFFFLKKTFLTNVCIIYHICRFWLIYVVKEPPLFKYNLITGFKDISSHNSRNKYNCNTSSIKFSLLSKVMVNTKTSITWHYRPLLTPYTIPYRRTQILCLIWIYWHIQE